MKITVTQGSDLLYETHYEQNCEFTLTLPMEPECELKRPDGSVEYKKCRGKHIQLRIKP